VRLAESLGLSQRVRFLGHVSQDALFHHYKNCEIFCLPSVQEGFGIVFLEAMVAGKPIVAANAAAVPEVVRHGINGLLVAPNDSSELAEALLTLLENRDLREHLGRVGREGVQYYASGAVSEIFLKTVGLIADDTIPRTRSGRVLELGGELKR
jgi:glycosyltransferase involved in cell wall biosynthesis